MQLENVTSKQGAQQLQTINDLVTDGVTPTSSSFNSSQAKTSSKNKKIKKSKR